MSAEGESAPVSTELNLRAAVEAVLKQACACDGVARGLRECVAALDRGSAIFCLLAKDCDEAAYVQLVEALCAQRGITLIRVPEGKLLGQWVGLCKLDKEGVPRKVVRCSAAVVKSVGREQSPAVVYLNEQLKAAEKTIDLE